MEVIIYHNPRCGKSRQTLALLAERRVEARVIEYLKDPPSAAELKRLLKRLGMTPHQLVRRKEASEAGIHPEKLSADALIAAMVRHPITIERPIVVAGDKVALGRPPENVLSIL